MNNESVENKKLTKILFISGFGLLILFILIRLAFKSGGDKVTDMPIVGDLAYNPKKIDEKSKSQQFEEQRLATQRKEMGYDENNYVVPNFNELTKKNGEDEKIVPSSEDKAGSDNSSIQSVNSTERRLDKEEVGQINKTSSQQASASNSKLNYHSDYFSEKKDQQAVQTNELQQKEIIPTKNPFGTVSSGSTLSQNVSVNTSSSYKAEIYGDQKIENNGMVTIRNTEAVQHGSLHIPRNSILYGQASFQGNRVFIRINMVKTSAGEFAVALSILDNDRLEGIYYKAPIDETVDKTKEEVNIQVPGQYGGIINSITQTIARSGKEALKKSMALNLEEGYQLFIVPFKQN